MRAAAGGEVVLSFVMVDEERWAIAVSDTLTGIAPTDQESVGDERERGSLMAAGSGLGLAIVKDVAQQLGGVVRAVSRAGQGRRFEVVLPINPRQ